ncbi:MAG: hypothetical protein KA055_02640 [Aliarcobacter sp.]|nr:hypothetical protein [Aliarcobacter sp.]
MVLAFLSLLQEIFLLNCLIPKINKIIVKIVIGILRYSKLVKYVKTPLDIPKNKNKNAGKQQSVDKRAVTTAPNIVKLFFFK